MQKCNSSVFIGRQRHIRLFPLSVVEGHDIEPIKLPESKGLHFVRIILAKQYQHFD